MKLDTSGLESTAPLFGSSSSELVDEISAAPSFALPNTINVSSNVVLLFSLISYSHARKVEVLLAEYWLFFFFLFQFDGFQKEAIQMVKPAKGTTTLAFIFKEGVMVAADSRASMGGYICMLFLFFLFSILHIIIYGFWMLILYISISL